MNPYLALIAVVGIIAVIGWLQRLPVFRTCRCGARFCTTCGRGK